MQIATDSGREQIVCDVKHADVLIRQMKEYGKVEMTTWMKTSNRYTETNKTKGK